MNNCKDDEDCEGDGEEEEEDRSDDLGEGAGADTLQNIKIGRKWNDDKPTNIISRPKIRALDIHSFHLLISESCLSLSIVCLLFNG